jgi:transcriptional accessory protein Tex/SPT6
MKRHGMVHVSKLANHRVDNVETFVKQGQQVWVKVYGADGDKISLSMKDVDQDNGRDLNPANDDAPTERGGAPGARRGPPSDEKPPPLNSIHRGVIKYDLLTAPISIPRAPSLACD